MDKSIKKLIRPDLAAFAGYSAATSPETLEGKTDVAVKDIVKLDANENPYGCSPKVKKALAKYSNFHVYTDDGQTKLRELLSKYIGLDASCIVAGSGSNQLIDLVLRLFLNPGDEVIICPPTFGIYGFSTKLCAGNLVEVPRDEHFGINVGTIKAAITKRTKVICLANPNNPTGTIIPQSDILELLDTGIPLLLDEAYYEFCGETLAARIGSCENLMILRTFSKWAGLAGLRIGYGLFPPDIADMLMKIKMPYNVNVAAVVAVQESLKDLDYLVGRLQAIVDEKNRLFQEIKKLGWLEPFPSHANFLLCQVLQGEARRVANQLQKKGILVRYFDQPRLRNFIRISVGKPEHTDILMKALGEIG